MKLLFISKSCQACTKSFIDFVVSICSDLDILEVRQEEGKFYVYRNDEKLPEESPVQNTPVLFIEDSNEVIFGKLAIRERLVKDAN